MTESREAKPHDLRRDPIVEAVDYELRYGTRNAAIRELAARFARLEKAMPSGESIKERTDRICSKHLGDPASSEAQPSVREIAERCHGDLKNLSCICTENTRCEDCEEEITRIAQAIEDGVAAAEVSIQGCRKAVGRDYDTLPITEAIRQCRNDRDRERRAIEVWQRECGSYQADRDRLQADLLTITSAILDTDLYPLAKDIHEMLLAGKEDGDEV